MWTAATALAYRLGHASFDRGLFGPLAAGFAWAALAAAEHRTQPIAPKPIEAEDSPWRKAAGVLIFCILPLAALDATLDWPSFAVGVCMTTAGAFLRWWSLKTLGPLFTWTTGVMENHRLIRAGPYRYFKHPNYLGSAVFASGIAWMTASTWAWIPVGFLAVAIVGAARQESNYLRTRLPGYH